MVTKHLPRQMTPVTLPMELAILEVAETATGDMTRSERNGIEHGTADVDRKIVIVIMIMIANANVDVETRLVSPKKTAGEIVTVNENETAEKDVATEIERDPAEIDQHQRILEKTPPVPRPFGLNAMMAMTIPETQTSPKLKQDLNPRKTPTHLNAKHAIASECNVNNRTVMEPSLLIRDHIVVTLDRSAWWVVGASITNTRMSFDLCDSTLIFGI